MFKTPNRVLVNFFKAHHIHPCGQEIGEDSLTYWNFNREEDRFGEVLKEFKELPRKGGKHHESGNNTIIFGDTT